MVNTTTLKDDNKHWHQDHAIWKEEAEQWLREAEKLVALLYLLERALPEHSSILEKHLALINQHEQQVSSYECGMDERCMPSCPTFKSIEQQAEFHKKLSRLHALTKQEHYLLKQSYSDEMEKFKSLAKKLFEEC